MYGGRNDGSRSPGNECRYCEGLGIRGLGLA